MRPYSYRDDPVVPSFPDDKPVIIFDGLCALCSGSASFVLRHDGQAIFRLTPAQSPLGQALYLHYGLNPKDYETMILIADGVAFDKSEAAIRIAKGLGFPWSIAAVLRMVPLGLRDRLYAWVARNRIRWFGARTACFMPDPRASLTGWSAEPCSSRCLAVDKAAVLLLELTGRPPFEPVAANERREPFQTAIRIII